MSLPSVRRALSVARVGFSPLSVARVGTPALSVARVGFSALSVVRVGSPGPVRRPRTGLLVFLGSWDVPVTLIPALRPPWPAGLYSVDVPTMSFQLHDWDIHIV
jgi:hypothetical protein